MQGNRRTNRVFVAHGMMNVPKPSVHAGVGDSARIESLTIIIKHPPTEEKTQIHIDHRPTIQYPPSFVPHVRFDPIYSLHGASPKIAYIHIACTNFRFACVKVKWRCRGHLRVTAANRRIDVNI